MHRRSILKRCVPSLIIPRCLRITYPVLADVSIGYPGLEGRLSTCYSPVRHWAPKCSVRLACIRHAASVHPEPGSNSPFDLTLNELLRSCFSLINCFFELTFLVQFSKSEALFSHALVERSFIIPNAFPLVNIFFYFFLKICIFFVTFLFCGNESVYINQNKR